MMSMGIAVRMRIGPLAEGVAAAPAGRAGRAHADDRALRHADRIGLQPGRRGRRRSRDGSCGLIRHLNSSRASQRALGMSAWQREKAWFNTPEIMRVG